MDEPPTQPELFSIEDIHRPLDSASDGPAPSDLGTGDLVGDSVRLVRPLAAGGMGAVWVGRHERLEIDVAVKLIHANVVSDEALRRFELEAKAAARIQSPHTVSVFDYGAVGSTPYIVMELLEGESLERRIYREQTLAPELVASIVRHAARGLEAAHARGILHRDVKPSNVWLCPHENGVFVKLLDFGIARSASLGPGEKKLTQAGMPVGTPHYMSPEQLFAPDTVDARSDVWGLAVCAYEMLTGAPPFDGDNLSEVCMAVSRGSFEPVSDFAAVPPELDAVFDKALALDRDDRYPSPRALAEALGQVLAPTNDRWSRLSMEPPEVAFGALRARPTPDAVALKPAASTAPIAVATKRRASRAGGAAALSLVALVLVAGASLGGSTLLGSPPLGATPLGRARAGVSPLVSAAAFEWPPGLRGVRPVEGASKPPAPNEAPAPLPISRPPPEPRATDAPAATPPTGEQVRGRSDYGF